MRTEKKQYNIMLLNESQKKYAQLITEELHVTDQTKVNWMAQYAQIHAIHEGIETPGAAGYNAINQTPLNTIGAGNPMLPYGTPGAAFDPVNGAAFHDPAYVKGSGDVPMSTLSTALEIAAVTIGFDLVPVVPAAGPMVLLTWNDYPYAGGKLGLVNETALDGKGNGADNKPIYIALTSQDMDALYNAVNVGADPSNPAPMVELTTPYTVTTTNGKFTGLFMGVSRINGAIIMQVKSCKNVAETENISIAECFRCTPTIDGKQAGCAVDINGVTINLKTAATEAQGTEGQPGYVPAAAATYYAVVPELVKGVTDHIQSFSNFFGNGQGTPSNDPMSRAENETGTGNMIGARMFSKMVRMGAYEATGGVTRQQLQDYPLYGIDVLGGVIETCQNEISQALNNRILDRLFKLGVTNYETQRAVQHVDLNLYLNHGTTAGKQLSTFAAYNKFINIMGQQPKSVLVPNAVVASTAENVITNQRRIMSRMLAASNLIASVTRRGRGQWVVTNTQILTALQDCAGFTHAPMVNDLVQGGEESLYFAGTLAGLKIYVDPYMLWEDTRVLVGRKAVVNNNRVQGSGVVFMPYILADQVQIIAEGTMSPKVLINSRFAIVDTGWYPEQNYYCFMVDASEELI